MTIRQLDEFKWKSFRRWQELERQGVRSPLNQIVIEMQEYLKKVTVYQTGVELLIFLQEEDGKGIRIYANHRQTKFDAMVYKEIKKMMNELEKMPVKKTVL